MMLSYTIAHVPFVIRKQPLIRDEQVAAFSIICSVRLTPCRCHILLLSTTRNCLIVE